MSKNLRILYLEDNDADVILLENELQQAAMQFSMKVVKNRTAFMEALKVATPDLILADYTVPTFGAVEALQLVRDMHPELPFICMSETIGEESAVDLMRQGATDYVPKKNLRSIVPAIHRALREMEHKIQKRSAENLLRDSESRFRAIFEGAGTGIAVENLDGRIIESNCALQQMLGYSAAELQELTRKDFTHSRDHREDDTQFRRLLAGDSDYFQVEKRFVRKDGRIIWGRLTVSMVRDGQGKPQFPLVMIEDITERQRAEEAYLQYAAIVEFSNDAIISTTFDGIIFSWNPAAERVYGFSATEANGRSISMITPPDKEHESEEILERLKRGEHIESFETTRLRRDGLLIHVSITPSPIKEVSGKITGISTISRDITERKRAEAALRDSEENYRKLVEFSPDGILIQSEGAYVYLNRAALDIFGARDASQIVGKAALDVVHPSYHEVVKENLRLLSAGRDVPLHEEKLIRVDGSLVDVEATAIPFVYRGKPAFQVVTRDITERKRAEEALRRSEASLARAQQIAHLGSWEWEIPTQTLTWSDETYRIFGLDQTKCACNLDLFFKHVHPDDREMVKKAIEDAITARKTYKVDHRIILPEGQIKTVTEQAEIQWDDQGQPLRMVGTVLDITERKRAENLSAAFSKLGERLSTATTGPGAARIIAEEADKLFGWDACNLALCSADLQSFYSIFSVDVIDGERRDVPPSSRLAISPSPRMRRVIEEGAQLILRDAPALSEAIAHPFGDKARPSASMMYVPVRNGPKIIGVFSIQSYTLNAYTKDNLDMLQALGDHCGGALERIRAEAENQKLAAFPQFNPDPVLELDTDGSINYFNEAAQQMAVMLGKKHPSEFLPPQIAVAVQECLATDKSLLRQQSVVSNRTISWSLFPIQKIGVVHCYATDVTERQNLEDQLRQAQKMESVGQLAGGIAHDFNNILTVIQGHISLLTMLGNLTADAQESAQQISMAAERAANLTRQLLTFSRRQVMQPKNLDLNEVVNNMTKMLRRLLGEDVTLQVSYTPGLPPVHADPGMMEQILMNLSVNARDAMPKGGRLYVTTSLVSIDESQLAQTPEASVGDYVCLTVKDTGKGIAPDILPHIFEPFFTTKDVGKGTGLGLATVYGIVQQHRGWIKASSTLGTETIFQIFLPAANGGVAGVGAQAAEPKIQGGKETILVVEDESPLRALVRSILERYGYRVLEAASGMTALSIWHQNKDQIQMLLTDMVMPHGISGRELAKKFLSEKPELKVIYSSGYSLAVVGTDMVLQDGLNFLQKPYNPRKLAQAVRDCLDGKH